MYHMKYEVLKKIPPLTANDRKIAGKWLGNHWNFVVVVNIPLTTPTNKYKQIC